MIKRIDRAIWIINDNITRCIKMYDTLKDAVEKENYIKRHWSATKVKIIETAYLLESDTKNNKDTFDNYTIITKKNKDVYVFLDRMLIDKWNLRNF